MKLVVTLSVALLVWECGYDTRYGSTRFVNVVVTKGMNLLVCECCCDNRYGSIGL